MDKNNNNTTTNPKKGGNSTGVVKYPATDIPIAALVAAQFTAGNEIKFQQGGDHAELTLFPSK